MTAHTHLTVGEFDIAVYLGDGGVGVFALGQLLRSQAFGFGGFQLALSFHHITPIFFQLLQVTSAFGFGETTTA